VLNGAYKTVAAATPRVPDTPSWENAERSTDIIYHNTKLNNLSEAPKPKPHRPFVPLAETSEIELKGDYFMEGGMYQEALRQFGVAAKIYSSAYPENHPVRVGIAIKLGAAFLKTNRLESSKANLEHALYMLDNCTHAAPVELICETILRLGETYEALGDPRAGRIYEDVQVALNVFHSIGEPHRMQRLLPRLSRRLIINFEEKFRYMSPFDNDRTFALADEALGRAEQWYAQANDAEGIVRVLTLRKQMLDRKFFNMRDTAGRIRTLLGHWRTRAKVLTNAPTPDEILRLTPTIHEVHRDFRHENTAPRGRENEVIPGLHRVILDDGNPFRRIRRKWAQEFRDVDQDVRKYVQRVQWTDE
jgi:tetratricopeptide (TPR) repeat protein